MRLYASSSATAVADAHDPVLRHSKQLVCSLLRTLHNLCADASLAKRILGDMRAEDSEGVGLRDLRTSDQNVHAQSGALVIAAAARTWPDDVLVAEGVFGLFAQLAHGGAAAQHLASVGVA